MHQIAKINHCETSILGGIGIAVKLARVICQRASFRLSGDYSAGKAL